MWIHTVTPEAARGALRRVYEAAVRRAGRVFQIVKAMSLAPETLEASLELYQRVMLASGALPRRQREMLAVVVSGANGCHY
jgi:alkylhydroperoxidase family enzyme